MTIHRIVSKEEFYSDNYIPRVGDITPVSDRYSGVFCPNNSNPQMFASIFLPNRTSAFTYLGDRKMFPTFAHTKNWAFAHMFISGTTIIVANYSLMFNRSDIQNRLLIGALIIWALYRFVVAKNDINAFRDWKAQDVWGVRRKSFLRKEWIKTMEEFRDESVCQENQEYWQKEIDKTKQEMKDEAF